VDSLFPTGKHHPSRHQRTTESDGVWCHPKAQPVHYDRTKSASLISLILQEFKHSKGLQLTSSSFNISVSATNDLTVSFSFNGG
jgi:hypothetical protein